MEFYGNIVEITGYPGRPTFIIAERGSDKIRSVRIIDAHDIRGLPDGNVDLFLNGNLLKEIDSLEVECLVIVEVHNIKLDYGLFLSPHDYLDKQVYVNTSIV